MRGRPPNVTVVSWPVEARLSSAVRCLIWRATHPAYDLAAWGEDHWDTRPQLIYDISLLVPSYPQLGLSGHASSRNNDNNDATRFPFG
jgi:hypothetical protein